MSGPQGVAVTQTQTKVRFDTGDSLTVLGVFSRLKSKAATVSAWGSAHPGCLLHAHVWNADRQANIYELNKLSP